MFMIKFLSHILHRQEAQRLVGQFSTDTLRAHVHEVRERHGSVEYWIDVQWTIDGKESSTYGLLRRTAHDTPFDVMREAQRFLQMHPH